MFQSSAEFDLYYLYYVETEHTSFNELSRELPATTKFFITKHIHANYSKLDNTVK